jgi:hypothetical protein
MSRLNGILSDDDKMYLTDQKEFEGKDPDKKENAKRYRIRQKIVNGINDLDFLVTQLAEEDRQLIFEDDDLFGVRNALTFLYAGMRESDRYNQAEKLRGAVASVEDEHAPEGLVVDRVDFSLSYTETEPDIDKLRERIEAGEPLTDSELGRLVRVGALTQEMIEDVKWDREEWDLEEIDWERSSAFHPREN